MSKSIKKTIIVEAPIEIAFEVFARNMSSWWDLENKHIGASKAVEAVLEPEAGGRWYEKGEDGTECDWGRVIDYDPPRRLVLNWQISAQWTFDPTLRTEVEVLFQSHGESSTLVELEHRNLDQFGDAEAMMREVFDSQRGWPDILEAFAQAARTAKS